MTLAQALEARKPQPKPIPEWMRRRQEAQEAARKRWGTDRIADKALDR